MNKYKESFICFLLFLFASNFAGFGSFFFILIFCFIVAPKFLVKKRLSTFIFSLFCLFFWFFFSLNNGFNLSSMVYYLFFPLMSMLIGQNILTDIEEYNLKKIFLSIIFGLYLHGFLNNVVHIETGNYKLHTEYLIDFWTNQNQSRISQGLFFTPLTSLVFLYFFSITKFKSLFFLLLIFTALAFSILIGNRTIFFAVLITNFLYFLLKKDKKQKIRLIVSFTIVIIVLIQLFDHNFLNMKLFIENSYLFRRVSVIESSLLSSSRFDYYLFFLENIKDFLFGKKFALIDLSSAPNYIHNLWMDLFYYSGFFPTILFILFNLLNFKTIKSTINSNVIKNNSFFGLITLSFLIQFLSEPVFLINPYYMLMYYILIFSLEDYLNRKDAI